MIRLALPVLTLAVGCVLLVETAIAGGGVGYLLGAAFLLAGGARLWVSRASRRA